MLAVLLLSPEAGDFGGAVRYLEQTWRDRLGAPSEAGGGGVLRCRGLELLPVSLGSGFNVPIRAGELPDDSLFFASDWFRRSLAFARRRGGSLAPRLIELIGVGSAISTDPMRQLIRQTINLTSARLAPAAAHRRDQLADRRAAHLQERRHDGRHRAPRRPRLGGVPDGV